jgi:hypothetical protein
MVDGDAFYLGAGVSVAGSDDRGQQRYTRGDPAVSQRRYIGVIGSHEGEIA